MSKRKLKRYTKEFKAEAVRLVKGSDKAPAEIARDLGVSGKSLRDWVKQHDVDAGKGPPEALTTEEREELRKLRRENRDLRMEREILKKATAFFAKESQ
jgi:transposase